MHQGQQQWPYNQASPQHNGSQVVVQSVSSPPPQIFRPPVDNTYPQYSGGGALVAGLLQLLCGIVNIVFQAVATAYDFSAHEGYSGFWAGAIFVIAGGLGVASARSKTTSSVSATLAMSIIAAIFSMAPITQGWVALVELANCNRYATGRSWYWEHYSCSKPEDYGLWRACSILMLVFGIIEFIASILSSVFCCQQTCCSTTQGVVVGQAVTHVTTLQYQPPHQQVFSPAPHHAYSPAPQSYPMAPAQPVAPPPYTAASGYLNPVATQPHDYTEVHGYQPSQTKKGKKYRKM